MRQFQVTRNFLNLEKQYHGIHFIMSIYFLLFTICYKLIFNGHKEMLSRARRSVISRRYNEFCDYCFQFFHNWIAQMLVLRTIRNIFVLLIFFGFVFMLSETNWTLQGLKKFPIRWSILQI